MTARKTASRFNLECGCGAGINFNVFSNGVHQWIDLHECYPVDDENHWGVRERQKGLNPGVSGEGDSS